jgi:hypothetical protein
MQSKKNERLHRVLTFLTNRRRERYTKAEGRQEEQRGGGAG